MKSSLCRDHWINVADFVGFPKKILCDRFVGWRGFLVETGEKLF
jgi:hypothetical protein